MAKQTIVCDELDSRGIGHPRRKPVLAEPCRHVKLRRVRLPARHRIKGKEIWQCAACGETIRRRVPGPTLRLAAGPAVPAAGDPRWKPLRELLTALMAWNAARSADLLVQTDRACEAVARAQARIIMAEAGA